MHCDRVYAILTRGPFPSGEVTDVAVEIHLAHCVECRRLAEALRPLEDHTGTPDTAHLPGYRGDHPRWDPDTSPALAQNSVLLEKRWPARWQPGIIAPLRVGGLVAAVLIGLGIGIVLTTIQAAGSSTERPRLVTASFAGEDANEWAEARVQAQLIYGLNLPRACNKLDTQLFYPLSSDERSPMAISAEPPSFVNQCCTQCHVAGGRTHVGQTWRVKLISSCTICHADNARSRW
jgi:hypothetical protein